MKHYCIVFISFNIDLKVFFGLHLIEKTDTVTWKPFSHRNTRFLKILRPKLIKKGFSFVFYIFWQLLQITGICNSSKTLFHDFQQAIFVPLTILLWHITILFIFFRRIFTIFSCLRRRPTYLLLLLTFFTWNMIFWMAEIVCWRHRVLRYRIMIRTNLWTRYICRLCWVSIIQTHRWNWEWLRYSW